MQGAPLEAHTDRHHHDRRQLARRRRATKTSRGTRPASTACARLQSINLPLELGGSFYFTKGFGIDLALGTDAWLPQQSCLHDDSDTRLCTETDLDCQTSFFIGGGLAFLP